MLCPKCGSEINDKAWRMHQILCPGKANIAGAAVSEMITTQPVVSVPPPAPAVTHKTDEFMVNDEGIESGAEATVAPPKPDSAGGAVNGDTIEPKGIVLAPEQHSITGSNGSEVFTPVIDPYFMANSHVKLLFEAADGYSKKHPTNILITGQPGGGKTSLAIQFAAIYKRPITIADFGVVQEPQQLFQTTRLIEKEGKVVTDTRESAFIRGIETPQCVVVMDELTRVENERCLNPLMPLLDGRRETWIDDLRRRVHVADGVIFIATINEGSMFAGISSLDAALRDRFIEVYMDYLPAEHETKVIMNKTGVSEKIALSLAGFAAVIRRTPNITRKISTRQLLHAAEMSSCGVPLWLAITAALGNYNDPLWRQQCMEVFSLNIRDDDELAKWQSKQDGEYVQYV